MSARRRSGTWRLAVAAALTGAAAGAAGAGLTKILHAVQHVAFGYSENTFLVGVEHASAQRRVLALAVGGLAVGVGWWLFRRVSSANVSVTHALAERRPRLPVAATLVDALLQIAAVGVGASLGREGAPRQAGAALGGVIAQRLGLDRDQSRIVLAAGAGAGLAAVYNVPLGGFAFAMEVLLGTWRPRAAWPALLACVAGTVVAWPVLGRAPTYHVVTPSLTASAVVAAAVVGLLAAPVGFAFRALMRLARTHAPRGARAVLAMVCAFTGLGALAITYPSLLGNGKGLAQLAFGASLSVGLALVLAVLKPLATAACLGSGAIGGLLTPAFATGAALGLFAGRLWTHVWAGAPLVVCAVAGAAALLAVTQRAPITAAVLTVEFTHVHPAMLLPIAVAVIAAGLVAGRRSYFPFISVGKSASGPTA